VPGILAFPGCSDDEPVVPEAAKASFEGVKLAVGAFGDAAILEGISAQRGEWVASRKGEVAIRPSPVPSLDDLSEVDLLIFPGQELGNLVDRGALEIIPNQVVDPPRRREREPGRPGEVGDGDERPADPFQSKDLAPAFRDQVSRYGSDRLALPLGGSALVLVYRRDAFARSANIEAARAAGIALEPPATWAQLDALARFFHGRDWDGDGKADQGIAAVLGRDAEGLGDTTFLARAAGLGQHRDQFSFLFDSDSVRPRIDSPPFVEALRGVLAWRDAGPPGMDRLDGAAAREAFRAGKVALLIDRAERARDWSRGKPVGVAPLPGSERVFEPLRKQWENPTRPNAPSYLPLGGGWLVAVRKGLAGTRRDAALDLALYLSGPELVNRLRAEPSFPMLPVRSSQMGQGLPDPTSAPDVDARQWSDAVSRTLMAERVIPGLRIPEASGYLEDLTGGRLAALAGKDPEAALREVARAWEARTQARGRERQLWHYRRSLNAFATLPDPPAPAN
jgi:multiple sugar transport system substrate-binding protein